jgi:hypothetical protein
VLTYLLFMYRYRYWALITKYMFKKEDVINDDIQKLHFCLFFSDQQYKSSHGVETRVHVRNLEVFATHALKKPDTSYETQKILILTCFLVKKRPKLWAQVYGAASFCPDSWFCLILWKFSKVIHNLRCYGDRSSVANCESVSVTVVFKIRLN